MTSLAAHLTFFLLLSFVTALVTVVIRARDPKTITKETMRLFLQISAGIIVFCGVVFVVELIWVRSLV